MNVFRILGDVSHTASKCILIWAIHSNRSAEGVSLITQALYACVFITRYLDVFDIYTWYNFVMKVLYILSSLYIIFLMMRVYSRTREREKAWQLGAFCLGGSVILAPLVMLSFRPRSMWDFMELCWIFSIILESVCVLPQLLLLRQTTVPTVIDSYYLLTLGSYRGFYILNWIWREIDEPQRGPDAISITFGVIQTAFYIDFAWVYYSRQRVKLRNGGVVDADDMSRGWLLRTVFGSKVVTGRIDDDDESGPTPGYHANGNGNGSTRPDGQPRRGSSKWGARGISVSADNGVLETERDDDDDQEEGIVDTDADADAKMRDPDDLAKILEEDDEEGSDDGVLPSSSGGAGATSGVGNGAEWREGRT